MIKTVYIYLMNHAVQKISMGNWSFVADYLHYVHALVEKDFFLENNCLDYGRYRNTIISYLIDAPSDIKRVKNFIKTYNSKVFYHKTPTIIIHFFEAYIACFEGAFQKADNILSQFKYSDLDTIHKISLVKLRLQIMYEESQNVLLVDSAIKSLENFITNKSDITTEKKKATRSFISLYKKLTKGILTKSILKQFSNPLSTTDYIWFLSKSK